MLSETSLCQVLVYVWHCPLGPLTFEPGAGQQLCKQSVPQSSLEAGAPEASKNQKWGQQRYLEKKKTLTADHFFWKPTCATLGFLKGLVLLARDVSLANWGYLCRIASTHWEKFTKLIAPTSASSENARRCGAVISTILPAILSVGSVIRSGALALKVFDAVS